MTKFEYKFEIGERIGEMEEMLNRLGSEGWEMVAALYPVANSSTAFWLKRPLDSK
jgi:hypothetical protein